MMLKKENAESDMNQMDPLVFAGENAKWIPALWKVSQFPRKLSTH